MRLAFFGSSLLSSYWNGAATYYRGLLKALAGRGYDITFYEPDAFQRQENRDIEPPEWSRVVIYSGEDRDELDRCLSEASNADVVVKASGVGVFDKYLEASISFLRPEQISIFWDVDAPATLDRIEKDHSDPFREQIPSYSAVLTYGGGRRVVDAYERHGARVCLPIYNAVDPETHLPVSPDPRFDCDLAFLANRLPDRERRAEEFFFAPARLLSRQRFLLGGSGWSDKPVPKNVRYLGHVSTEDHNAFNVSSRSVLNVNRDSMASWGFSPATRVFEAAAAEACIITDDWPGIDAFFHPGSEILVAKSTEEVCSLLTDVVPKVGKQIGQAARKRVLEDHTYVKRAKEVDDLLRSLAADKSWIRGVVLQ
jgi:spore maturation protein CgeB